MTTMWLSFVDPDKPKGERFLGVSIVDVSEEEVKEAFEEHPEAHDREKAALIIAATQKAYAHGCNPGGEVLGHACPTEKAKIPEELKYRLLSAAELEAADLI